MVFHRFQKRRKRIYPKTWSPKGVRWSSRWHSIKNQLSSFFFKILSSYTVTPQNRYVIMSPIWTSLLGNHIVSLASARSLRELEHLNRNCRQRKYIQIVLCYSHVFHKHIKRKYIPLLFHGETGPLFNTRDGWRSVQNTSMHTSARIEKLKCHAPFLILLQLHLTFSFSWVKWPQQVGWWLTN